MNLSECDRIPIIGPFLKTRPTLLLSLVTVYILDAHLDNFFTF